MTLYFNESLRPSCAEHCCDTKVRTRDIQAAVVVVVTVALVDVVEETVVEEDTVEVEVSVKEVEVELLLDDVLDVPWP